MRWLITAMLVAPLLAGAAGAAPQASHLQTKELSTSPNAEADAPVIDDVVFTGLRRIAPAALQAQISTHAGDRLNERRIEADVRALARLGWCGAIRVETQVSADAGDYNSRPQRVLLTFHCDELPFLAGLDYSGSRLLSHDQLNKLLAERNLLQRLGAPADPAAFRRVAWAIQSVLAGLGHPQARVQIRREEFPNGTVRVHFEISDGPHIAVGRVNFEGHPEVSAKLLQRQMRRIRPGAAFARLRGKTTYTREAFEEDRERILAYYQNHGYPEGRIGAARPVFYEESSRRWFPWPHRVSRERIALVIPVEAGHFYRVGSVEAGDSLLKAVAQLGRQPVNYPEAAAGQPYSAQAVEHLRRAWLTRVQSKPSRNESEPYRNVTITQALAPDTRTVRVKFGLAEAPPYIVRRLEFRGPHRFSDRYFRRRILLEEGRPLDERVLEAGLARLARTGYIRPIKKEGIHIQTDEIAHAADVTIRVEEVGQQRASFIGGHGAFGSTLGIAYTLFDLLNREEFLSAQIEGGPESLQIALGLAKEGFLGSRGSLALSVFNNVLRPHLAGSVKGPFFTTQSEGVNLGWSYAVTNTDSLGVNYGLSRSTTRYSLDLPAGLTGLPPSEVRSETSSRAFGLGWTRDTGNERILFSNSVSGGWLGGSENLLRSSAEYGRIVSDPIFNHKNAWAFRTTLNGVGSYHGDMPLYARLFSGDELVRGFRAGELGPYAITSSETTSGAKTYSALPAGADFVNAANLEYRKPLASGAEAVGFFDLGSGWLLPNWMGHARPSLLNVTNGVLHGSSGVELRWTVPGLQVPVRAYYALNVLRLDRSLLLPDGSLFRAGNRFSAFGWALGTLF